MLAYDLALSYWCAVITVALVTPHVAFLSSLTSYGKLRSSAENAAPSHSRLLRLLFSPSFYLPNGLCFTSYYLLASLLNAYVLFTLYQWSTSHSSPLLLQALLSLDRWSPFGVSPIAKAVGEAPSLSLILLCAAMQLHVGRRLWECLRVHRFSASQQHALVWLFGALFYAAAVLSPLIDELRSPPASPLPPLPLVACGVLLFAAASWWQTTTHRQLGALRSTGSAYAVPASASFRWLLCPHYTAEMGLYLAFCCLRPSLLQLLALLWTAANLSVTARKTRQWYLQRWPNRPDLRQRWAVLPFIL